MLTSVKFHLYVFLLDYSCTHIQDFSVKTWMFSYAIKLLQKNLKLFLQIRKQTMSFVDTTAGKSQTEISTTKKNHQAAAAAPTSKTNNSSKHVTALPTSTSTASIPSSQHHSQRISYTMDKEQPVQWILELVNVCLLNRPNGWASRRIGDRSLLIVTNIFVRYRQSNACRIFKLNFLLCWIQLNLNFWHVDALRCDREREVTQWNTKRKRRLLIDKTNKFPFEILTSLSVQETGTQIVRVFERLLLLLLFHCQGKCWKETNTGLRLSKVNKVSAGSIDKKKLSTIK